MSVGARLLSVIRAAVWWMVIRSSRWFRNSPCCRELQPSRPITCSISDRDGAGAPGRVDVVFNEADLKGGRTAMVAEGVEVVTDPRALLVATTRDPSPTELARRVSSRRRDTSTAPRYRPVDASDGRFDDTWVLLSPAPSRNRVLIPQMNEANRADSSVISR